MKPLRSLAIKVTIIILTIILLTGAYIKMMLPNVADAPNIQIELSPDRISGGKYLAQHVAVCMDCHSQRDWKLFSGPIIGKNLGGGGESFTRAQGFPGNFYASNITPYRLGDWTDGEILRAITVGADKDGRALFPLMAYHRFGKMDYEDILNIIAYLRTLPPVVKDVPRSKADFPISFLINTMPEAASFTQRPGSSNTVQYGEYLVNAAGCVDCHSKTDKGKVVPGSEFGGGMEFKQPAGTLISPDITAHPAKGIGRWTRDAFIQKFKTYADSGYQPAQMTPSDLNTPMPWTMYAGMTGEDLGAIYDYLKTIEPKPEKK